MASLKLILLISLALTFVELLFCVIATAVVDWSKSNMYIFAYGIWKICAQGNGDDCINWEMTGDPAYKTCEGSLVATRAFSVLSIIFLGFCFLMLIALLVKPTLMTKVMVLVYICMASLTCLWVFLGWVMYLGVEARGHCQVHDYDSHLGSSWFLQFFAWLFSVLALYLACWLFLVWKKLPREEKPAQSRKGKAAPPMYPYGPAYGPMYGKPYGHPYGPEPYGGAYGYDHGHTYEGYGHPYSGHYDGNSVSDASEYGDYGSPYVDYRFGHPPYGQPAGYYPQPRGGYHMPAAGSPYGYAHPTPSVSPYAVAY